MRRALLVLLAFAALRAQPADPWQKLSFLLGDWTAAAGSGDANGAGQGAFSFQAELDRKIIVRKNYAQYDSGQRHDDLMIVYLDGPASPRAIYFDSEGHVIRYALTFPSANRAVFESEAGQAGPRYRLSYWMEGAELKGRFEVAAPGGEFRAYLNWASKKR